MIRRVIFSPYLWMIIATASWGSFHPIGKIVMRAVNPVLFIVLQIALAFLTLAVILAVQGRARLIVDELRTRLGTMALLGLLSFAVSLGGVTIGLSLLPASLNGLLANTCPLFVAVGTIAVARGRVHPGVIAGVIVGFIGLGIVIVSEDTAGLSSLSFSSLDVFVPLFASLATAVYLGIGRRVFATGNALAIVAASSLFGVAPWLILSLVNGDFGQIFHLEATVWLVILYIGVIGTGVAFGLQAAALRRLSAARVAVFQYSTPFWAVILSALLLGEPLTLPLILGGLAIIGGIAVTQRAAGETSGEVAGELAASQS